MFDFFDIDPIPAFSGPAGHLVLTSGTRPDAAQLFIIERLGQLLGAALTDAELHERDHRRAHELYQLNNQLARTVASLQHRQAVQEALTTSPSRAPTSRSWQPRGVR